MSRGQIICCYNSTINTLVQHEEETTQCAGVCLLYTFASADNSKAEIMINVF